MAFDTPPEESTGAPDGAPEAPDTVPESAEAPAEAASEPGESLSMDVFGDKPPTVGDMVTLKVTAIDPENGRVSVMLPAAKKMGGIAKQAAMLDEGPA